MSEINPAGGTPSPEHDPYYQKLPAALEVQVATAMADIDGEIDSFQSRVDDVAVTVARGISYAEQADTYNRRERIIKRWGGGLMAIGGGTCFALEAANVPPNPLIGASAVAAVVGSFALSGRAWNHRRHAKKYENAVDEAANSLYPTYVNGIIGKLPIWMRKSYERQHYEIPDYANDTKYGGEYRSLPKSRR